MLKEFAVDPRVIASSFETCRYLISQFGADKGRLISKFPNKWKRLAFEAADKLPDGLQKERIVEYLNSIGNEWLTFATSNRAYLAPGDPWLNNAVLAHAQTPFQGILCEQDDPQNQLVNANECDEANPLFAVNRTRMVSRTANDLAQAAALLLQNCHKLRLVDPYFDPGRPKWWTPLAAILAFLPNISRVECEYHLQERGDSPSTAELIRRLQQLKQVIPEGGTLRIIRWKEKPGGERFHRRYLLTENAGLYYEGGLDEATGANQTTDVSLIDRNHHANRWAEYNQDSQVYELVEPILVVDSTGKVTETKNL
ncbi:MULTISPECIES: hypothetical protein [unclassified Pseudomonas]|uniref:Uncharacterized protein n=1 Tax=Pseudomonas fluorescens TaxID=294 RepID=A0A5E6VCY0_PSEFL|nr:hypothetical protein PS683_04054 [Pseudomonas fluorescens]VVN15011.1 hypothetical protein PS683_04054 [Pseudomonas fluorescens]